MNAWLPEEESHFQTGNLHASVTCLLYSCFHFLRDSHHPMAISNGVLLNLTCPFYSLYCVHLPMFLFAWQGLWLQFLKDILGGETGYFLLSSSSLVTWQMCCLLGSPGGGGLCLPNSIGLFQQPWGFICHRLPCSLCQWPPGTSFWSLLLTLFQTQQKACLGISFLN